MFECIYQNIETISSSKAHEVINARLVHKQVNQGVSNALN